MRRMGAIWESVQRPLSSGEMRPLARTALASMIVRDAPRYAKAPRWTRWKSVRWPFCALYVHIGATQILFGKVTSRILRGVKSVGRLGVRAVPAGGDSEKSKLLDKVHAGTQRGKLLIGMIRVC